MDREKEKGETYHALLFELDSIQDFIFSTGRLRDVSGASELLDRLTNRDADDNLLDAVCRAAGLKVSDAPAAGKGEIVFSRRTGGAFYAFGRSEDDLDRLCVLWTLAIQKAAPYLTYSLGTGTGESAAAAFEKAREALRADSGRLRSALPAAAPVATRSRRTGLPAVEYDTKGKDGVRDAATARRKAFADLSSSTFLDRFAPEESSVKWNDWPRDLEPDADDPRRAFPFRGESRILALVHADGNGLGLILQALNGAAKKQPDRFIALYTDFSALIEQVTTQAAKEATRQVLLPARDDSSCLAARPILLGGDDITLLVRADLAMDYVRHFTEAFEAASREALLSLKAEHGLGDDLPEQLTLGIGLVYLRASQPFRMAIGLAESLTKVAKQTAKKISEKTPSSSIAFYRVTSSLVEDYDALRAQTLTHHHGETTFVDTLGAYFLGEGNQSPRLGDLLDLAGLLGTDEMARGPARQLLTLMGLDEGEAKARYRRWRMVIREERPEVLEKFDALMERLAEIGKNAPLPYTVTKEASEQRTPLGDLFTLLGAGHTSPDGHAAEGGAA